MEVVYVIYFNKKILFFFNLTLLIPFSHMPVLMNEA